MLPLRFLFPGLVVLAVPFVPPKSQDFPQFVSVNECEMVRNKKVVILKAPNGDRSRILTKKEYAPPFALRIKAKTDSKNLRLYYKAGIVIFNWELKEDELRIHDPATGEQMGVEGKGYIEPDKWHDIKLGSVSGWDACAAERGRTRPKARGLCKTESIRWHWACLRQCHFR